MSSFGVEEETWFSWEELGFIATILEQRAGMLESFSLTRKLLMPTSTVTIIGGKMFSLRQSITLGAAKRWSYFEHK